MERMTRTRALVIRQRKEWGEILTGFEARNRYAVLDTDGREIYLAAETSGSLLARIFLGKLRPFDIRVVTPEGAPVLAIRRPFRWFFHEVHVSGASGQMLGTVKQRFAWLRRRLAVRDASDLEFCELYGPILHPWTFEIREGERVQGRIVKRWSGIGKEVFTDADNFGVEFPQGWDVNRKAILLAAVFLVDFLYFERSGGD
jgi:hypothetical protein